MSEREEIFRGIVDVLEEGVHMVGPDRAFLYWNRGAERITGFACEEVLGSRCCEGAFCHLDAGGNALTASRCPLARTLGDGRSRKTSAFVRDRHGRRVKTRLRTTALRDREGRIVGAVELLRTPPRDAPKRQRLGTLERLAYADPLTGLPNRRFVEARLGEFLSETNRYERPFGVVLVDVDSFKSVNDSFGHTVGDRVLTMVGRALRSGSRRFDVVGRWGGDEFVALVKDVDSEQLERVVEKYHRLVAESRLAVDGRDLRFSVSCGAILAEPGLTTEEVIARADARMYQRKRRRRATRDDAHRTACEVA